MSAPCANQWLIHLYRGSPTCLRCGMAKPVPVKVTAYERGQRDERERIVPFVVAVYNEGDDSDALDALMGAVGAATDGEA